MIPVPVKTTRCLVSGTVLALSLTVLISCGDNPASRSAEQRPIPQQLPPGQRESVRKLPIAGADNFRDLGGYITRDDRITKWGVLYRADDLAKLTAQDQVYLERLAIKQVVDFRSVEEKTAEPDQLGDATGIELVAMPITVSEAQVQQLAEKVKSGNLSAEESRTFLITANREFVASYTAVYRQWLHTLLDADNLPTVFHCTAGKDRTGLAAAILLLAVGVDRDTVMQDYLASNHYTEAATQRMLMFMRLVSLFRIDTDALRPVFTVEPQYIEAAFQQIENDYGSFENYLRRGLDIDPAEQQQLIELFTEPQSQVPQQPAEAA